MQFYKIITDENLKEKNKHGTIEYPFAYYVDDIRKFDLGYIDWHWHHEVEFITVTKGSVDCLVGDKKIHLKAGSGIFINSGIIHRFETSDAGTMPNIVFAPELIAPEHTLIHKRYILPLLINAPAYQVLSPNIAWQDKLLRQLSVIYKLQEDDQNPSTHLKTLRLVTELWNSLYQNLKMDSTSSQEKLYAYQSSRLQVMLQFIHDNYKTSITLEDIAKSTNISKSSALEIFRSGIGQAPISYLIIYRIRQAAILLRDTKRTISYVSSSTGFSSDTYFCRKFKEYYKVTPSEYRRQTLRNYSSL